MLAQLYIKNIAVIQEAAIEFGPAFNVFTGETGAGKTMLISAINGVLGERLSKDIIRTGEEKAYISALFSHIPPAARLQIEEKGYDLPEGELLISRELGARNSCKINGRPATLQILKEIASLLIDIHGQKDSHRLLDPAYHMEYIDSFGGLEEPLSAYQEQYRRTVELRKKLAGLSKNDREKQQRLDLLHYQIQEIQSAWNRGRRRSCWPCGKKSAIRSALLSWRQPANSLLTAGRTSTAFPPWRQLWGTI